MKFTYKMFKRQFLFIQCEYIILGYQHIITLNYSMFSILKTYNSIHVMILFGVDVISDEIMICFILISAP